MENKGWEASIVVDGGWTTHPTIRQRSVFCEFHCPPRYCFTLYRFFTFRESWCAFSAWAVGESVSIRIDLERPEPSTGSVDARVHQHHALYLERGMVHPLSSTALFEKLVDDGFIPAHPVQVPQKVLTGSPLLLHQDEHQGAITQNMVNSTLEHGKNTDEATNAIYYYKYSVRHISSSSWNRGHRLQGACHKFS